MFSLEVDAEVFPRKPVGFEVFPRKPVGFVDRETLYITSSSKSEANTIHRDRELRHETHVHMQQKHMHKQTWTPIQMDKC